MSTQLLSSDQCIKRAFNPEFDALDVKLKETSVSFSLNHNEDSVTSVKKTICSEVKANEAITVLGLSQLTIYATVGTEVSVSPVLDKEILIKVGTVPDSGILTLNICAARLVINVDGYVVGV